MFLRVLYSAEEQWAKSMLTLTPDPALTFGRSRGPAALIRPIWKYSTYIIIMLCARCVESNLTLFMLSIRKIICDCNVYRMVKKYLFVIIDKILIIE